MRAPVVSAAEVAARVAGECCRTPQIHQLARGIRSVVGFQLGGDGLQ